MTGIGCCARAASGHTVAPPSSVIAVSFADPNRTTPSIAGHNRASQQKRPLIVRYGSILLKKDFGEGV
jgi:hypothetical protein